MSSKDTNKAHSWYSLSGNIEIMIGNEADEIIQERFDSLLLRYEKVLEEKMNGSKLVLDRVYLLHYKLHKVSLNRSVSYIDFPKWLKKKN